MWSQCAARSEWPRAGEKGSRDPAGGARDVLRPPFLPVWPQVQYCWCCFPSREPDHYATMTGELYSVPLPDGSLVTLNTRSAIRIDYSAQYRDIHLGEGEALFEAVEDIARPFRVIVDQAMVRGGRHSVQRAQG